MPDYFNRDLLCVLEQKPNGSLNFQTDGFVQSLSKDELLRSFYSLGYQTYYLWSMFLKFHRLVST